MFIWLAVAVLLCLRAEGLMSDAVSYGLVPLIYISLRIRIKSVLPVNKLSNQLRVLVLVVPFSCLILLPYSLVLSETAELLDSICTFTSVIGLLHCTLLVCGCLFRNDLKIPGTKSGFSELLFP